MTVSDTRNSWPAPVICVGFPCNPFAVRGVLEAVQNRLSATCPGPADFGAVELVLAEVLNNIVEHACAADTEGRAELAITKKHNALECVVVDTGNPMPGGTPPVGQKRNITCVRATLPEGGFGWAIIRELAYDLSFRREGGKNRLSFRIEPDPVQGSGSIRN